MKISTAEAFAPALINCKTRVDLLTDAGKTLFGPRWKKSLAHALGVTDRTILRWSGGDWIPSDKLALLADILDAQVPRCVTAARNIRDHLEP